MALKTKILKLFVSSSKSQCIIGAMLR